VTVLAEAAEAAALWGGTVHRLLGQRENAVFEMALPGGTRAALRLHRHGYRDDAAITSELWWCAALAQAGVAVPAPLPALSGALLQRLASGRCASAIAWAEGEALGAGGQPLSGTVAEQTALYRSLGRLLAQVHSATDAMTLPAGFVRPRWDSDGLTGDTPLWGRFWEHPALTPDDAATLRHARDALRERLADLARHADIGPIHADVLRENVLVSGEGLSLIDFDDCGTGFRLYDLGTAMLQNLAEPACPAIRDALIDGYGETRAIDPGLVPLFTLARCLASVGWTMPRLAPDDPIHRSHIARAVICAKDVLG